MMLIANGITTVLLVTVLGATIATTSNEKTTTTTCDAGFYHAGKPAFITCNFPVDITVGHHAVIVEKHPLNSTPGAWGKDVLNCAWDADMHWCTDTGDFRKSDIRGHHLTVEIPNASKRFTAAYFCHTLPLASTCTLPCTLIIEENPTKPSQTTISTTPDTKETTCTTDNHQGEATILYIHIAFDFVGIFIVAPLLLKRRYPGFSFRRCLSLNTPESGSDSMSKNNSSSYEVEPEYDLENNISPFDAATVGSEDPVDMMNPYVQPLINREEVKLDNATFTSSQSPVSDVPSDGEGTTSSSDVQSQDEEPLAPQKKGHSSPILEHL